MGKRERYLRDRVRSRRHEIQQVFDCENHGFQHGAADIAQRKVIRLSHVEGESPNEVFMALDWREQGF